MTKNFLSAFALVLLLCWPTMEGHVDELIANPAPPPPERVVTAAEMNYLNALSRRGLNLDWQGVRVESLDGLTIYADHQSDQTFNPASVVKIATSFAALVRWGPDHHFETAFYAVGDLDRSAKTLYGDLILAANGDPILTEAEINRLIRQVVSAGVSRVTGRFRLDGPLTFGSYQTPNRAASRVENRLRQAGVRILGAAEETNAEPALLAKHTSASSLREIVFDLNARSVNATADRLGAALGGPDAVEDFLITSLGFPLPDIQIRRASGLNRNRMTSQGTIHLLRAFAEWLNERNLGLEDVLPIAGIDSGTLQSRFRSANYRGAVVGKTGTLPNTDGGVSSLAGLLYTREHGPVLFAIYNTRASVDAYRQLQDAFLQELIQELGGMPELHASARRFERATGLPFEESGSD